MDGIKIIEDAIREAGADVKKCLNEAMERGWWPAAGKADASERHWSFFLARALARRGYDPYFEVSNGNGNGRLDLVCVNWRQRHVVACEVKNVYRGRPQSVNDDVGKLGKFSLFDWRRPPKALPGFATTFVLLASTWHNGAEKRWSGRLNGRAQPASRRLRTLLSDPGVKIGSVKAARYVLNRAERSSGYEEAQQQQHLLYAVWSGRRRADRRPTPR